MTNVLLVLVLFAVLAVIGLLATSARGGPLDPEFPPGETAGVRLPGTPISGPTTISQPGHYYLTNDIAVTGSQNAIAITSSSVSLDLAGFHIIGGGGQNSVGIGTSGLLRDVHIQNGSVQNFYLGIDLNTADHSHIEDVFVRLASSRGIVLGDLSVLEDCIVIESGEGIVVEGTGATVSDCNASSNQLNGIFVIGNNNVLENSEFHDNSRDSNFPDTVAIRLLGVTNIVRGNNIDQTGNDMYITGTGNLIQDNSSICPFVIDDAAPNTTYIDNSCLTVQ